MPRNSAYSSFMERVLDPGVIVIPGAEGKSINVAHIPAVIARSEIGAEMVRHYDQIFDPELWAMERKCGLHKENS